MLSNIITNNNLECTAPNGYAISEEYSLIPGILDKIYSNWEYVNISIDREDDNQPDLLQTTEPISDGDNLVIIVNNIIHNYQASSVVDDTGVSGFYQMDTFEITQGEIPDIVFYVDKSIQIDFGSGYDYLVLDTEEFSYDGVLTSNVTYQDFTFNSYTSYTKVDISCTGTKMINMSSISTWYDYRDCFITQDGYKIKTADGADKYYFCALTD